MNVAKRRLGSWRRVADRYSQLIERMTGARSADELPRTLDRRRIYVLPTGFGLAFGTLIFVMLMGALNFNNNMGLAFTFVLGALGLVAPLLTFLNLHRIELVDVAGERAHAGEPCRLSFRFRGAKASGHWSLQLTYGDAETIFSIYDDGTADCGILVETVARGWFRIRRAKLSTRYPIGLFRAWAVLSPAKPILVYPSPENDPPPLPSGGGSRSQSSKMGGADQFAGIREYQREDPPRLVAWKAVARTGDLHSKQFTDSGPGRIQLRESELLHLDLEARVSRLTAWVLLANEQGVAWSLQIGTTQLPSTHGEAHLTRSLEALALHET